MKAFEEFYEENKESLQFFGNDDKVKIDAKRGWSSAYEDFQELAQIRFVKGIGAFATGYNGCMRSLETALEEVIENALELHIYQMIRETENNILRLETVGGLEDTLAFFKRELQVYKLALKQHLDNY